MRVGPARRGGQLWFQAARVAHRAAAPAVHHSDEVDVACAPWIPDPLAGPNTWCPSRVGHDRAGRRPWSPTWRGQGGRFKAPEVLNRHTGQEEVGTARRELPWPSPPAEPRTGCPLTGPPRQRSRRAGRRYAVWSSRGTSRTPRPRPGGGGQAPSRTRPPRHRPHQCVHEPLGRVELGREALDVLPARGEQHPFCGRPRLPGSPRGKMPRRARAAAWHRAGGAARARRGRAWSRGRLRHRAARRGSPAAPGSYWAVRTSLPWQCRTKRWMTGRAWAGRRGVDVDDVVAPRRDRQPGEPRAPRPRAPGPPARPSPGATTARAGGPSASPVGGPRQPDGPP